MTKAPGKFSKIFVADMQILGSAFCFGIGFLGQRAVMVRLLLILESRLSYTLHTLF